MLDQFILDDDNNVVRVGRMEHMSWWARVHADIDAGRDERNRVGRDNINGISISTVFSPLPLPSHDDGDGYCHFESMTFGADPAFADQVQGRYRTWAEAKKGHDTLVALATKLTTEPKELGS